MNMTVSPYSSAQPQFGGKRANRVLTIAALTGVFGGFTGGTAALAGVEDSFKSCLKKGQISQECLDAAQVPQTLYSEEKPIQRLAHEILLDSPDVPKTKKFKLIQELFSEDALYQVATSRLPTWMKSHEFSPAEKVQILKWALSKHGSDYSNASDVQHKAIGQVIPLLDTLPPTEKLKLIAITAKDDATKLLLTDRLKSLRKDPTIPQEARKLLDTMWKYKPFNEEKFPTGMTCYNGYCTSHIETRVKTPNEYAYAAQELEDWIKANL